MKIKNIIVYPIKSLGGIQLEKAKCTERGLEHDRRMMLADGSGQFITQREFPKLATIGATIDESGFIFFDKNNPVSKIAIGFEDWLGASRAVRVWKDEFRASQLLGDASSWFSNFIGKEVSLYKMTDSSNREKALLKSPGRTALSMSDGYPYLVLSMSSLADLNTRLSAPVTLDRFRANIILDDTEPYQEETLDSIKIGHVPFRMIKPCARCSMITINQKTGNKLAEPLKTLSSYKKSGNKVYFGMNAISLREGEIRIGDKVSEIN